MIDCLFLGGDAMAIRAWRPVNEIKKNQDQNQDQDQYLYHYTTMEKAYSILCSNELWFSELTSTNDIFEQKVKISFNDVKKPHNGTDAYQTIIAKIKEVRKYMDKSREKIKLLCFSRDLEFSDEQKEAYNGLQASIPHDYSAINVIGRGFSLPRMWAQYASNNKQGQVFKSFLYVSKC